jgi:hypothetical protein
MKVVIDTNVVVSANLCDEGLPAAILDLAAAQRILMCVSPVILAEYETVLAASAHSKKRLSASSFAAARRRVGFTSRLMLRMTARELVMAAGSSLRWGRRDEAPRVKGPPYFIDLPSPCPMMMQILMRSSSVTS